MLIPIASTTSSQNLPSNMMSGGALRGGADVATGDFGPRSSNPSLSPPQDEGAYAGEYSGAEVRVVSKKSKKSKNAQAGEEPETRYFESGGIDLNELKRRMEKIEQESQDGRIFGVKLPPRVEKAAGKLKERIDDLQQAINFSAFSPVSIIRSTFRRVFARSRASAWISVVEDGHAPSCLCPGHRDYRTQQNYSDITAGSTNRLANTSVYLDVLNIE
jgi:hypothetical protein